MQQRKIATAASGSKNGAMAPFVRVVRAFGGSSHEPTGSRGIALAASLLLGFPLMAVAAFRPAPWIALAPPETIPARPAARWLEPQLEPTAIALGDFDGDGAPDLIVGHGTPSGGAITRQAGDPASLGPKGARGRLPFRDELEAVSTSERPDWVLLGDFDADSNLDLALAARGGVRIEFRPGDGQGHWGSPSFVELDGTLSALVAGEVNRPDGLTDLVAGVESGGGAAILVFESPVGAERASPERIAADARVDALAVGGLDESGYGAIVAAAGSELLVVAGRDRRLTGRKEDRDAVSEPQVEMASLPGLARDLAIGDFVREDAHRLEIAVLGVDGGMTILGVDATSWRERPKWTSSRSLAAVRDRTHILAARSTSLPVDGLLVISRHTAAVELIAGESTAEPSRGVEFETASPRDSWQPARIDLEIDPIAAAVGRFGVDALDDWLVLGTGPNGDAVTQAVVTQPASTFTVTNTNDSGIGSLRKAIADANSASGADMISFAIPGAAIPVIAPASPLPKLTSPASFDPSAQAAGYVAIDGSAAGATANGIEISAGNSAVWSLLIQDFGHDGVVLQTAGGNLVADCRIGLTTGGTAAAGNRFGVLISGSGATNTIGGLGSAYQNVISGNASDGIYSTGAATLIEGNRIGTNLAGTAAVANGGWGIDIYGGTSLTIGGSISLARNVISGNTAGGINLNGGSSALVLGNYIGPSASGSAEISGGGARVNITSLASGPTIGGTTTAARNFLTSGTIGVDVGAAGGVSIQGNFIGLAPDGSTVFGNSAYGVRVGNLGNPLIGGSVSGARNVVSGNDVTGIYLAGGTATILGNLVGLDATGTSRRPNGLFGIRLVQSAGTIIGGFTSPERNVVSGNGSVAASGYGIGIAIESTSSNVSIYGNYIGTSVTGGAAIPNFDDGVFNDGASSVRIGSTTSGGGNLISGNSEAGIHLVGLPTIRPSVVGNLIGLDAGGTLKFANKYGVWLDSASGTVIGGTTAAARNVISGNTVGIRISGDSSDDLIEGNYIGPNPAGTGALGNGIGITIDGTSGTTASSGYHQIGGTATSQRNLISGNLGDGIAIDGPGAGHNQIYGNFIGVNFTGGAALGNQTGIVLRNSSYDQIGSTATGAGNIVSGNQLYGISIQNGDYPTIQGNWIGTSGNGLGALANGTYGLVLNGASSPISYAQIGGSVARARNIISGNGGGGIYAANLAAATINGNSIGLDVTGNNALPNVGSGITLYQALGGTVGGTSAGDRNTISGNSGPGIVVWNSDLVTIQGNFIGPSLSGLSAVGNTGAGAHGIHLRFSSSCVVGGSVSGAGNVIMGNDGDGVLVEWNNGSTSPGNTVAGNVIGLFPDGVTPFANNGYGVRILDGSSHTIGGTLSGSGNVISGNFRGGIAIESETLGARGNGVFGNHIGTDATGTVAIGNQGPGVHVIGYGTDNTIGLASAPNIIANNVGAGIWVQSGSGTVARSNSLYANDELGIDLDGGFGVTANDLTDSDGGPNGLQNFPVITAFTANVLSSQVSGTFQSLPSTTYQFDLYSNDALDALAHGEGKTWVATFPVSTNSSGFAAWSYSHPGLVSLPSLTATHPTGGTSEFSAAFDGGHPTEAGSSAPLLVTKGSGSSLDLSFGAACNVTRYAVYSGTGPISGSLAWAQTACNVTTTFDPGTPAPGSFVYFVVVAQDASNEGSFGHDSTGAERPEGAGVCACCVAQRLDGFCP